MLVAAVAVLVGQAEMWAPQFMESGGNLHVVGPKWVNVPAFLISGLALLWRRRAPMAVLAVVVATGTVQVLAVGATEGLGWYLPLLVALYSVARRCDTWPAGVGLAMALAAMAVHDLRDPLVTGWSDVSLFYDIIVIDWVAGRAFRAQQHRSRELEERAAEVEHGRDEHARQVVANERERIARELHDLVAHSVSLVILQCLVAVELLDAGQPGAGARAPGQHRSRRPPNAGGDAAARGHVTPRRRSDISDAPARRRRRAGTNRRGGRCRAACTVAHREAQSPLPPGLDLSAYRIIQEALTNTLKHAGARHARVELKYCPEALEIGVVDDGTANRVRPALDDINGGRGVIGMRERATLFEGSFRCGPLPGGGWEVRAYLPIGSSDK